MTDQNRNRSQDTPGAMQTIEQIDSNRDPQEPDIERLHAPIMREKLEPREGFQPIPMTLLFGLFVLLMWGGWYLGEYDADFQPQKLDGPTAFIISASSTTIEPMKLDPLVVGKRIYNNCVACHQADGNGNATYPPLNNSDWVNGRPEVFAAILLHGIKGPFEVDGRRYDNEMPPWGARLTDFEIAAVMSYARSNWQNSTEAIDESVVKEIRKSVKRSGHWTMEELVEFRDGLLPANESSAPSEPASEQPETEDEAIEK